MRLAQLSQTDELSEAQLPLGQPTGSAYVPALRVRSFPSRGVSYRVWSTKAQRVCHLLSRLEFHAWLVAEFRSAVVDIREQFPAGTTAEAEAVARALCVPRRTENAAAPTTDLVLTVRGARHYEAISCKYEKDLRRRRTRELLAIEEELWRQRGVAFRLFTERSVSRAETYNMLWLLPCRRPDSLLPGDPSARERLLATLRAARENHAHVPVGTLAMAVDRQLAADSGTGMAGMRYLVAQSVWPCDLRVQFSPTLTMRELGWI